MMTPRYIPTNNGSTMIAMWRKMDFVHPQISTDHVTSWAFKQLRKENRMLPWLPVPAV